LDALTLEFSFLLTNQLETQRHYFEQKISTYEQEHKDSIMKLDQELRKLCNNYKTIQHNRDDLQKELENERRDKKSLEKKIFSLQSRIAKLEADLMEECQMNLTLLDNQQKSKHLESSREGQINDLLEQVRDLTFSIETMEKIEKSPNKKEIQEGSIVIKSKGYSHSFKTGHKQKP
jgi:BRCA1-associated protein